MHNNKDIESILEERGIKPTSNRILILRTLLSTDEMLSVTDIEDILESVDKSTVFRTITLFQQAGLVHFIDDGTGSLKYAVCSKGCSCTVKELHTHFYCEKCEKTFCFKSIPMPSIDLPEGFSLNSANYVLKCICKKCSKQQ